MSGGFFDFNTDSIKDVIDEVKNIIRLQGKEIPIEYRMMSDDWYEKYPEEKYYGTYSKEVQEKLQEAIVQLKKAYVYVNRIDYFFSGDDGEESFLERLEEELKNLK